MFRVLPVWSHQSCHTVCPSFQKHKPTTSDRDSCYHPLNIMCSFLLPFMLAHTSGMHFLLLFSGTDHGQYVNNRLSPIRWFQSIIFFFFPDRRYLDNNQKMLKKTLKKLGKFGRETRQKAVTNSPLSSKNHQNPPVNIHSGLIFILNREMISVQTVMISILLQLFSPKLPLTLFCKILYLL